jgi:hypothetical protein
MTPKEKAQELVDKFKIGDVVTEKLQVVNIDIYSQLFALRAVDEIIKEYSNVRPMFVYITPPRLRYWQEVKQEIEKL